MALVRITTKGMAEAQENLKALESTVALKVVKDAARAGGKVLLAGTKVGIYRGLTKRSGLLATGLGVNVGVGRGGNRITAYVKEREVKTTSSAAARTSAFHHRPGGAKIAARFGAFYWRFLELGVQSRRTSSGANRGALTATGNVRAAFQTAGGSAVDAFTTALRDGIEREVSTMRK